MAKGLSPVNGGRDSYLKCSMNFFAFSLQYLIEELKNILLMDAIPFPPATIGNGAEP
jgi:hypothetical protein